MRICSQLVRRLLSVSKWCGVTLAAVFSVTPAWAALDEWDAGGSDAYFETNLNWADNTRPGSDDTAQFNNGVYEVWFDQTTVATYKREMIERGMSADEIAKVIESAMPPEDATQRWITSWACKKK